MTGETTLTYTPPGNAAISLDVVHTQEFTWNPVVDARGKLMYYAVTLRCFCVLNDTFQNPRRVGQNAVNMLNNIQHGLNTPRGTLVLTIGGVEILRSPAVGYTVDCANGPFVLDAPRVFAVHGYGRSLQCQVSFQTFVNRCRTALIIDGNEVPTAILSHTWSMHDHVDQDYYTVRTIRGRMVFRSDVLTALARVPDDYRILMTHPLPRDFKRLSVDVVANDDGNTADYVIVDKETARNILALGVSRIECVHAVKVTFIGWEGFAERVYTGVMGFVRDIGGIVAGIATGNPSAASAAPIINPFGIGRALLPGIAQNVIVRVYGVPKISLATLSNVARRIIASRVSGFVRFASAVDSTETRDVVGTFVEINTTFIAGLSATIVQAFSGNQSLFPAVDDATPVGDIVPGIISGSQFNSLLQHPPNSDGMRGRLLSALVAQALTGACATPPSNQSAYLNRNGGDYIA